MERFPLWFSAESGATLPATLVFEYPTVAALARHLSAQLGSGPARPLAQVRPERAARTDEPIAVIGMACRYPGGVHDPDSLWYLLLGRTDAIARMPAERWDADALYDPRPEAAGKMAHPRGRLPAGHRPARRVVLRHQPA